MLPDQWLFEKWWPEIWRRYCCDERSRAAEGQGAQRHEAGPDEPRPGADQTPAEGPPAVSERCYPRQRCGVV